MENMVGTKENPSQALVDWFSQFPQRAAWYCREEE